MDFIREMKRKRDREENLKRSDPDKEVTFYEDAAGNQSFKKPSQYLEKAVTKLNDLQDEVTIAGSGGTSVTVSGQTITVESDALPEHMEWVNDGTHEGLAVYDDPPTNSSMVALVGKKDTKTSVYLEDSQADFEAGELEDVEATAGGLELGELAPSDYLPHGNRTAIPQDLTDLSTDPGLEIKWTSTEPTDTDITIETAVKGETSHTDEAVGTGDGAEDTFYLDYYPAERHSDVVVSVDGTPTAEFTRANADDPREITFNAGHEPGDTLAVTATYTGVTEPSETAEVQTLYLGGATGGTYDLGITGDMATLAYDDVAATIETALEAIYGTDLVTVADDPGAGDFIITFSVRVRASGLIVDFEDLTGDTDPTLAATTAYSAGDWEEQTTATAITNIPAGSLAGQHLWIRQTLETSNAGETPSLTEVEVYYGAITYGVFTTGSTIHSL